MARNGDRLPARPPDSAGETMSEMLTVSEAAALLRVDRKTLYSAIRRGDVRGVIQLGRVIRIQRRALVGSPPGHAVDPLGRQQ